MLGILPKTSHEKFVCEFREDFAKTFLEVSLLLDLNVSERGGENE